MSATVANDAFLVKGLGVDPDAIKNPLLHKDERWSGEKMIIIPAFIHESLDRSSIVQTFAKVVKDRTWGCVVLTPSAARTVEWKQYGAIIADKTNIDANLADLQKGARDRTHVIVNRYDGIDLPDDVCRVLILDSKPYSDCLTDRYMDECRSTSEITASRAARTIEQGLGRSVRGEKDYCVVMLLGTDLVQCVRLKDLRKYLSPQTQAQIEIGLDVADLAKEDLETPGRTPIKVVIDLIKQCLHRDATWKAYYVEQMNAIKAGAPTGHELEVFACELNAELRFENGDIEQLTLNRSFQPVLTSSLAWPNVAFLNTAQPMLCAESVRYMFQIRGIIASAQEFSQRIHNGIPPAERETFLASVKHTLASIDTI